MAISDARRRANEKYNVKAYEQILLRVKKGRKAELQAHAAAHGESLNAFLCRAAAETLERDQMSENGEKQP